MVCSACNGTGILVQCRNYTVYCDTCCPHNKGRFDMQIRYSRAHRKCYFCVLCGVVFINETSDEKCRCEECLFDFSQWGTINKGNDERAS